jgi:CRP-like cAMP-binding protein
LTDAPEVLARTVIPEGKVFIEAGKECGRAYFIQKGKVRAFVMDGDNKIEVACYGPGTLIGEICLVLNEPMKMNYEAVVSTTVAVTTRQDFEKKLTRIDGMVRNTLHQIMHKLNSHDDEAIKNAKERSQIDEKALQLVQGLTHSLPDDKKIEYEDVILPHINNLLKAITAMKDKERHLKQSEILEKKVARIKKEDELKNKDQ